MIEYGFDAVLKSRAQMTSDDPVHKPVIGRLALAGMRTAMRTEPPATGQAADARLDDGVPRCRSGQRRLRASGALSRLSSGQSDLRA